MEGGAIKMIGDFPVEKVEKQGYSRIEHLAKTISLSAFNWQEVILAMFTACFDAGGSQHDQRFLVMAGFISSASDWIEFDKVWRKRLAEDGLSYFHMVDFAASQEEFEHGWKNNEPRRRKLLSDLVEIIRKHAYRRFGCAIENKVLLQNLSKEQLDEYSLNAYAIAGMNCTAQVIRWCKRDTISFETVEFVFEDGDHGKGKLIKHFNDYLGMTPIFKAKRDKRTGYRNILGFTPLQSADLLAYEIVKGCKEMDEREHEPRWGIKELLQIPGDLGIVDSDKIQEMEMYHRVNKLTLDWLKDISGQKI